MIVHRHRMWNLCREYNTSYQTNDGGNDNNNNDNHLTNSASTTSSKPNLPGKYTHTLTLFCAFLNSFHVKLQRDLKLGINMGELGYVSKTTLFYCCDEPLPDLIFMSHDLIFWETRVLFHLRVKQEISAKWKVKQRVYNSEKAETESCSSQKCFSFLLH